jgi:hypothetical protein
MDLYVFMGVDQFQPELARDAVRKFCVLYGALSKEADDNGHTEMWMVKPRFHMLQELGEYQVFILGNPRKFGAYADEDFVGWVENLACSRGGKNTGSTTPKNVFDRYKALIKL